jgi:ketosteroid isomerase-like protein
VSQENVEGVRNFVEGMKGDPAEWRLHPEIQWHLDSAHPDQRVLRGRDEVVPYFQDWRAAFDDIRVNPTDYIDAGAHVVMPFVAYGRLKGSAAEVPLAETWVFEVREGLVVEVREFLATDQALKAVGLAE